MLDIEPKEVVQNPFVAGAAGSLLGLRGMTGATWKERALHLLIGAACAGYGGPALSDWLHVAATPATENLQSFVAFGVGAFGISLYVAVTDAINRIDWAQVITGFVRKKGPGND